MKDDDDGYLFGLVIRFFILEKNNIILGLEEVNEFDRENLELMYLWNIVFGLVWELFVWILGERGYLVMLIWMFIFFGDL